MMQLLGLLACLLALLGTQGLVAEAANARKNMVLVYMDDTRPDFNAAYGRKGTVTPNFDRFARSKGTVVIGKAYANYPMCSPSRVSTLHGLLPTKTSIMTNLDEESDEPIVIGSPSIAKFLQSRGYYTATGGKVFHQPGINGDDCWNFTYTPTIAQESKWCNRDKKAKRILIPGTKIKASPQLCITKSGVYTLPDGQVAQGAVRALNHIVQNNLFPFFLSVGFYKPHVPLHIHQRFWNQVPNRIISDAERPSPPQPRSSFPHLQLSFIDDGNNIYAVKKKVADFNVYGRPMSKKFRRLLRRAYTAGITQSDFYFGVVYSALESHNLLNDTLIVFISDHGYSLGENNQWAKNTLFENALRVPMMISAPWLSSSNSQGILRLTSTFFELVDVYKTSLGMLGLDSPPGIDGIDHSQIVQQTIVDNADPLKDATPVGNAVSVVARCAQYDSCVRGQTDVTAIGFTYRDHAYRYVVYMRTSENRQVAWDRSSIIVQELYNHTTSDQKTIFNFENMQYDTEFYNIMPVSPPELLEHYWDLTRQAFTESS